MNLTGKTAVITGATGALGSVLVKHFLGLGATVGAPYTSEKSRNVLTNISTSGKQLLTARADLTSETETYQFVEKVIVTFGRIDILINAAGGYAGGKLLEESSVSEFEDLYKMNFMTALLMCRAALPLMRKQASGRIVNIAAMPAMSPKSRMGPYAVSKRAVITLTETLAEEVKGTGVTVNAVAPSIILTEANRLSMPDADFSKWVTPLEIAQLITYLSSEEARAVNGNVIKIYGGA